LPSEKVVHQAALLQFEFAKVRFFSTKPTVVSFKPFTNLVSLFWAWPGYEESPDI
jgi:hypothetical protein